MPNKFAKLYETDRGQVLLKLDTNDDGKPELRWYVKPAEVGVCSAAAAFEDSEAGWDQAEAAFEKADEAQAVTMTSPIFDLVEARDA